jgi:CheY-like chemotaxis protein
LETRANLFAPTGAPLAPAMGMRTVLIVEDVAFVARNLAETMRAAGWTVLMAGSAQQALTLARVFAIDLVIADVNLRDGLGVEVVSQISDARPHFATLYVSEYSRRRLERLLPARSRYAFVQLPASDTVLFDAVAALLTFRIEAVVPRPRSPVTFGWRCIPWRCVARRLNTPGIRAPRALRDGRIASLGVNRTSGTRY